MFSVKWHCMRHCTVDLHIAPASAFLQKDQGTPRYAMWEQPAQNSSHLRAPYLNCDKVFSVSHTLVRLLKFLLSSPAHVLVKSSFSKNHARLTLNRTPTIYNQTHDRFSGGILFSCFNRRNSPSTVPDLPL